MALTKAEIRQWLEGIVLDDRGWNWTQWNNECHRLSVHVKHDYQLADLEVLYRRKLDKLYDMYEAQRDILRFGVSDSFIQTTSEDAINDLKALKNKANRIALKWNTVKAEIRGRRVGQFVRNPIGTTYYIDLDSGNDGNDGLGIGTAWLTFEKYTTVTVRSPGDIALIRANTSEIYSADINFDEDGTKDSRISIIGCDSVTNDPWSDASDVKPILDANAGNYRVLFGVDYWYLDRLVIRNSTHQKPVWVYNCAGCIIEDVEIKDHNSASVGGALYLDGSAYNLFKNLTIKDNEDLYAIDQQKGLYNVIEGGTADGKATGNSYGVRCSNGILILKDVVHGGTQNFSNAHWAIQYPGIIGLQNVTYTTAPTSANIVTYGGGFYEEDQDGTYRAGRFVNYAGVITRQTSPITGNATESYKMEPDADCGLYHPQSLGGLFRNIQDTPFTVDGTASQQITCTIKIRSISAWGTYPTNTELYIEASYYDSGADAGRSTVASTQVLSDASSWVSFTITCTPLRDGPIYINVYLRKYEASKGVYVNGECTTS